MPLTQQERDYLAKHPTMQRLTFDGFEDLYQSPVHGAVTIARAIELDAIYAGYRARLAAEAQRMRQLGPAPIESEEMAVRRERLVDTYEMEGRLAWSPA